MKTGIIFLIAASIGGIAGSLITVEVERKKHREETELIRKYYQKKIREKDEKPCETPYEEDRIEEPEADEDNSDDISCDSSYIELFNEGMHEKMNRKPYPIPSDEVGTLPGYEVVSLTCYSDGTLADEIGYAMTKEEIRSSVGEWTRTIGRDDLTDEDAVYIRNDRLNIDYEIVMAPESYKEFLDRHPYIDKMIGTSFRRDKTEEEE